MHLSNFFGKCNRDFVTFARYYISNIKIAHVLVVQGNFYMKFGVQSENYRLESHVRFVFNLWLNEGPQGRFWRDIIKMLLLLSLYELQWIFYTIVATFQNVLKCSIDGIRFSVNAIRNNVGKKFIEKLLL